MMWAFNILDYVVKIYGQQPCITFAYNVNNGVNSVYVSILKFVDCNFPLFNYFGACTRVYKWLTKSGDSYQLSKALRAVSVGGAAVAARCVARSSADRVALCVPGTRFASCLELS